MLQLAVIKARFSAYSTIRVAFSHFVSLENEVCLQDSARSYNARPEHFIFVESTMGPEQANSAQMEQKGLQLGDSCDFKHN